MFSTNGKIYSDDDLVKILRFPGELSIAEARNIFNAARRKGSNGLAKGIKSIVCFEANFKKKCLIS